MTATATLPQTVARGTNSVLRMAAILAVILILAALSFAFGRSTADSTGATNVRPAPITHTAPQPSGGGCVNVAHTAPC
jgi:hypothetical protein